MGNRVVKLGTISVTMTGMEFWTTAKRYYEAAEALDDRSLTDYFDPIQYHLLCQSLELYLKGFIWMTDRLPRDRFRNKYGHDLVKLWRHAKQRGIHKHCTPTSLRDEIIEFISPYYKDRKFVYSDIRMTWEGVPAIRANRKVLPRIRRLCFRLQKSLFRPIADATQDRNPE